MIGGSTIYGEMGSSGDRRISGRVKLFERPNKAKEEAIAAVRDCCIYLTA